VPEGSRGRNTIIALVVILILILLLLLRCSPQVTEKGTAPAPSVPSASDEPRQPAAAATAAEPDEVLTPATLTVPERVTAGTPFSVAWIGPDNRGDYVTIVRVEAAASVHGSYQETKEGSPLELNAPVDPGAHEVRYVTGRSKTILGRAPVEVVPASATLDAAAEVVLGAQLSVAWTGPDNEGDYITIVPKETPDGQYGNYAGTDEGSPLTVSAPTVAGEAELRYMTGQGHKVLARRPIRIVAADVSLSAPADAVAGTTIEVAWAGPNNPGDYITVVARETPDGQYGNYTVTSGGSPLKLLLPIMAGSAELRYMTGQGNRVLGRRALAIRAAEITLSAPAEAAADSDVSVTWTGPDNPGDYITVVATGTPDGQYGNYTATSQGSPMSVKAPEAAGDAELRYMTGQGNKVLARRPIKIVR
jgi:Ca-activated chloride channel family protein